MTSPIPPPEVYALTWQGYVAHIVRMVSRIAMSFDQFRHALCEYHLFTTTGTSSSNSLPESVHLLESQLQVERHRSDVLRQES